MKNLVLGDLHQRVEKARRILANAQDHVDQIVLEGDYFDCYPREKTSSIEETKFFIEELMENPKVTLLAGNHDIQYVFLTLDDVGCGRFQVEHYRDNSFWQKLKNRLQLAVALEPGLLLTHAGLDIHHFPGKSATECARGCNNLYAQMLVKTPTVTPALLRCGSARNPDAKRLEIPGCTWADWNQEQTSRPECAQIVGHTKVPKIRLRRNQIETDLENGEYLQPGDLINCDTQLETALVLENNKVTII